MCIAREESKIGKRIRARRGGKGGKEKARKHAIIMRRGIMRKKEEKRGQTKESIEDNESDEAKDEYRKL